MVSAEYVFGSFKKVKLLQQPDSFFKKKKRMEGKSTGGLGWGLLSPELREIKDHELSDTVILDFCTFTALMKYFSLILKAGWH